MKSISWKELSVASYSQGMGWVIDVGGKCLQRKVVFITRVGGGTLGWVGGKCLQCKVRHERRR